jgi:hypothetical protein
MSLKVGNSEAELVDIRFLTDQMHVYSYSHVRILKSWLEEQGVNVVTLGSKSKPLVLVSPKEFEWAISRLAKRQELEARLQAGEVSHG